MHNIFQFQQKLLIIAHYELAFRLSRYEEAS